MAAAIKRVGDFFDEEAFLKSMPHQLVKTNLKGVYASPPPPDNFDPNKANATELIKQGLFWRRPKPTDDPAIVKAWDKVFSRKWLAKDRIVPKLEPQIGKTHLLRRPLGRVTDQNFVNGAWSGGGIRGGSWTGNIGFWDIPTVSQPSEPQGYEGGWNSSSWVGIDGFDVNLTSNDVLQAGVEQKVDGFGNPSYVAWYEWYAPAQPNSPPYIYQTNISLQVAPGEQMYCSIQYINNNTAGYIYIANESTGQYCSLTLAPPPGATFAGNTVEWIMEAPDGGEPESALPAFTPVNFTSAIACGPNGFGNPLNGDTCNVETVNGQVITSVTLGSYAVTIDFIG
ncbi:MAG TPA: G1 family glutamic endopeptidase [Candidatus Binataceae bacterium]|nr:G1 family glutamic endopeptidase [Candidatus Binataceae bacterium]